MTDFWTHITWLALLDIVAVVIAIPAVLIIKKGATSPVAWCLIILFLPLLGSLLFWIFGYTYLHRPLRRKRKHRSRFRKHPPIDSKEQALDSCWKSLGRVAWELDEARPTSGNAVTLYSDTQEAFTAILDAMRAAQHHIHLEFYIIRDDQAGKEFVALLTEKARQGVKVRLQYDSLGAFFFGHRAVKQLIEAGGQVVPFLPLNLFRSRLRVNLRNHRKIIVVDGKVAFTGGMNIGDEYLGRSKTFGYWRDQMLRIEGPSVDGLQRIIVEDWDFSAKELLQGDDYFPSQPKPGNALVQVVASGPDQEVNVIREVFFAAITSAQERVWIATPYFVPDEGILDALHYARYKGVEVRLLMPEVCDHFTTWYASRYYWNDVLARGVEVYLYTKGMMHSKFMTIDGEIGIVSSANMDQRSLHLNFEAGCVLYDTNLAKSLEASFEEDMKNARLVDRESFAKRSFGERLAENFCRLFSPIL
ncbi:MAG TPA: cardiolipin synthase [Gemmatales bacterium]|nr:cardiolipin synthase [Gemmatales bacterium]